MIGGQASSPLPPPFFYTRDPFSTLPFIYHIVEVPNSTYSPKVQEFVDVVSNQGRRYVSGSLVEYGDDNGKVSP